ncbi:O-antigen ligase family protein [Krasilnikovia sp. M28-CT-15]|uniref:O-antigen ligase family protein n=1 Tax=Krasilnikovia sp. M28-CT-15 TaxID=3373540 RepID=UPI003876E61E
MTRFRTDAATFGAGVLAAGALSWVALGGSAAMIATIVGLVAIVAIWVIRESNSVLWPWPVRLIPIHVAAALAPSNPDVVLQYGLALAVLTFVLSGQLPKLGTPDLLAIGLALWAIASSIDSGTGHGIRAADRYIAALALFIACRQVATDRKRWMSVAVTFIGGSLYVAWKAISQAPDETTDFRPVIDTVNINYAAYALVTAVVVTLAAATVTRRSRRRMVCAVGVASAMAYAIARTDTRAAVLAVVVAVIYLVVRRLASRAAWRVISLAVPAILITVAAGMFDRVDLSWMDDYLDRDTGELSGRLLVWPYARQAIADHPFDGLGPHIFPTVNPMQIGAHNLILTLGVDVGLVGIALYAAIFVTALLPFRTNRRWRHLAALLVLAWLPIWLTGFWELSPAAWITVALWSHLPAVAEQRQSVQTTDAVMDKAIWTPRRVRT